MITPGKTQRVERKDWMLAQIEAKATGNDSVVKNNNHISYLSLTTLLLEEE